MIYLSDEHFGEPSLCESISDDLKDCESVVLNCKSFYVKFYTRLLTKFISKVHLRKRNNCTVASPSLSLNPLANSEVLYIMYI